jgi:hypothetical protein
MKRIRLITRLFGLIASGLFFCLLLLLASSCSSSSDVATNEKTHTLAQAGGGAGFGAQTMVDSYVTNATVVSIDPVARKLELKMSDGKTASFHAGTNVFKFDEIKVGDQVKTTLVQELAVALVRAGTPLDSKFTNSIVAPPGGGAGYSMLLTTNFIAQVKDINPISYQVTLQLPEGETRCFKVRQGINIANFNPGDLVSVKTTEAKALLVEKP